MKLKTIFTSIIALSFLAAYFPSLAIPVHATAPFTVKITKISSNRSAEIPKIQGDNIVWSEDSSLIVYNLTNKKTTKIETIGNVSYFDIYGDNVVYMEGKDQDTLGPLADIYVHSLKNNQKTLLASNLSQARGPLSIYGDNVIWGESTGNVMYNLQIKTRKIIPTVGKMTIFQNSIFYQPYNSPAILLYDITSGQISTLVSDSKLTTNGVITGGKNYVVWPHSSIPLKISNYDDENISQDIYMFDLSSKILTNITTEPRQKNTKQDEPSISGDKIVYRDYRDNPCPSLNFNKCSNHNESADIYMYDIPTSKHYKISNIPEWNDNPSIYGNRIVWQTNYLTKEHPTNNAGIYLAELTYSTPATAPIKPTLTLSSLTKLGSKTPPQTIATSVTTTPVLRTDQSFTFSGTTSPNAKITLTIQSDLITTEVTAGKDGKWSYLLNPKTLNLNPGSHTVTAYATDTAGVKSDTIELTKFTLKAPIETSKPTTPEPYNYFNIYNIIATIIVLLLASFIIWRFMNKKTINQTNSI